MEPSAITRVPVDALTLRPDLAAAFPPTRATALERARAVDPPAYARTRNHLRGAVSRLSPYLTHGLVSVPDVLAIVAPDAAGKFAQELAWREFFQLVYEHDGRAIFADRFGPQPRRNAAAHPRRLPRTIVAGHTGIDALDDAVRALVDDGYVHNHARMWLASVEPALFTRHPWSRDRLAWILTAALEVPGLRVAVADARTLLADRVAAAARGDAATVRHRTHPAVAHWPGAGDPPPRAFAQRWTHASAPRSFSAFWKRVGPDGR